MNQKKKFTYSELSWLKLKNEFLSSKGVPLERFSFELSGSAYPKQCELFKRAKKDKWEYLKAVEDVQSGSVTIEETTQAHVAKELENLQKLTDNLELVYQTVNFCRDAQLMISNILPDIEKSLNSAQWNRLQSDPERLVNAFQKLVATFKTLNDIQAHYMGLTNPTTFLETVEKFDSNSTLDDVLIEVEQSDDQEAVSLIKRFL